MRISLIAAASANNVIGNRGELPWHLPRDLKRFKEITTGKPIVMGRLTWQSIGKPLPNRQNIVLSRNPDFEAPGCDIVASPDDAVDMAGRVDELMIIGGGQLYREFLPRAQRIYMTRVAVDIDGDAYFPDLIDGEWQETSREAFAMDSKHAYPMEIFQLDRVLTASMPTGG
ncbi:MAG: dihydrofolate reductase [Proteobacteria bacterium]|nr:dihydrofolate reductase [Pseudomonadota bacterium]